MNDSVVIARFAYRYQAEFAQQILKGAGIRAALLADDAAGMYVGLTFTNQARLLVHPDDRDAAISLLRDHDVIEDGEGGGGDIVGDGGGDGHGNGDTGEEGGTGDDGPVDDESGAPGDREPR